MTPAARNCMRRHAVFLCVNPVGWSQHVCAQFPRCNSNIPFRHRRGEQHLRNVFSPVTQCNHPIFLVVRIGLHWHRGGSAGQKLRIDLRSARFWAGFFRANQSSQPSSAKTAGKRKPLGRLHASQRQDDHLLEPVGGGCFEVKYRYLGLKNDPIRVDASICRHFWCVSQAAKHCDGIGALAAQDPVQPLDSHPPDWGAIQGGSKCNTRQLPASIASGSSRCK